MDTRTPSPFSASLLFGYVANYLYDGDAPLAERRAQALAVDQEQLRELLGEAELRELIDRDALAELEIALQCLDPLRRATSPDRLHDLLLSLGDLSLAEIAVRIEAPPDTDPTRTGREWMKGLVSETRAVVVRFAGEDRFAAAEDAGRLRDALSIAPPPGLPAAFLEPVPHALREVVSRYARTHGPFGVGDVAHRYGLGPSPILDALTALREEGRVFEGEFRPGGSGREWCGAEVLSTLRRRSLAALRKQVEPMEPEALVRLLVDWQGVATTDQAPTPGRSGGPDALLDVIEQLQGAVYPASILERELLPSRLPGYRPEDLDTLTAAGEVVWVGAGPLGDRDGRLALYLTDALPLLLPPGPEAPAGSIHDQLREHLGRHGASFFGDLLEAAGGGLARPVLETLWDLAWAGEVTNDTPEALRAFLATRAPRADRRPRVGSFRSRRQVPPSVVGRWSLVPAPLRPPSTTEKMKALAEQLLARHGVLTRDAVAHEELPGGFSAVYPVLRALEEAGRIRRGYFVTGRGGLQFALPGALERLRSAARAEVPPAVVLAATDPANPYGASLPWPRIEDTRLQRAAGSHVVLVDGGLVGFVARKGRDVVPLLPDHEPARTAAARGAAQALARWCSRTGRAALGWGGGGGAALAEGPLAPHLVESGFARSGPGFRLVGTGPDPEANTPGQR